MCALRAESGAKRDPDFVDASEGPCQGRPQADEYKKSPARRHQVLRKCDDFRGIRETGGIEQRRAEAKAEQQQADAGPAIRKG